MPASATTEPGRADPARWISGLLAPHRRWRWWGVAASLGVGLAVIAQAGALAWVVSRVVIDGGDVPAVAWVVLAGAVVLRFALQAGREACGRQLAQAVRSDVRAGLRRGIAMAGPHGLDRFGGGAAWASRYQADVDALGGWFTRFVPARDALLVVPLVVLAAVAWLDWLAAALLLFAAPLIPMFMALVGMGSQQVQARQQAEQHRMASHFLDRLRALDLIRRSGALGRAAREVQAAAERYRALGMRVLRIAFVSSAVMEFFSAVAIGMVAIYIGFGLLGSIDFGPAPALSLFSGLFVLLLAPEFFLPLRQLSLSWHDRAAALAAAQALAPLVLAAQAPGAPGRADPAAPEAPEDGCVLSLAGVRVAPAAHVPDVLAAVDLQLRPGEVVAVSGGSGSGKSTLLALCAGFIEPRAGRVARVARLAWLGQSGHLFHGSLRDNLRLAAGEDSGDVRLAQAMAEAGLPVDDPALPQGLDTLIGEGRRGLSGGQAQRVALARAWLSDARLWLLDEPTRGLDPETAEAVWQKVRAMAAGRGAGVLVATHDPRLQAGADRLLRIVDARVLEVTDAPA